ncbi:MAG TPA: glutamate--cysteine ligase [Micromonosporaceae bacterium]|jgi:glutamate---cysteine ligase / carboxylate-amine ligase
MSDLGGPPTVGVEEEFLLVDPVTGQVVPGVEQALDEVEPALRKHVERALLTSQIEINSPPARTLEELRRSLGELRSAVSDAAERSGVRLLALGTGILDGPYAPVADDPRFHRMAERFGELCPSPGLNGVHVHVAIPGRELGVQVINHLRPALPVLHAVTTNSPYFRGIDTGYASWRSILWARWPSAGPPPYLRDPADYDRRVGQLIDVEAMLDEPMLYWYARLSSRYPTVEIRVGDVCLGLDDTILLAALVRALVLTALFDVAMGREAPAIDQNLLVAAHWRAARDGLEGMGVDVQTGELRPAWHLLRHLVDTVTPALERHGDLPIVTILLGRLRSRGTGAAWQRATQARTGDLRQLLRLVANQTRGRGLGQP